MPGQTMADRSQILLMLVWRDIIEAVGYRFLPNSVSRAHMRSASLPRGEAVLEPKGCLPRWWAQGEEMRLPLEPPA